MSLKAFHIFFILLSILLCFGFGAWEIHARLNGGALADLVLGSLSLCGGVVLIFYFRSVLKKLKHISYL